MANISAEDLSNKNLSSPLIRTMEDDLKLLKINASFKMAPSLAKTSNSSVPPKPPINPPLKQDKTALNKIQEEKDKEKIEQLKKETEAIKEELARKEKERFDQAEREKAEQARKAKIKAEQIRIENEKMEKANKEKEIADKERVKKEQERLAQIEAQKELERKRKKDEEIRVEKIKAEQIRIENEKIEKVRKEKLKAERERIRKEKERLAQIQAEKDLEIKRKRDEELRIEREKNEQIRKEKEAVEQVRIAKEKAEADRRQKEKEIIEQAKREEAMKIRKKISEEIKKEMEEAIAKEKAKAEQVKIAMELEIKKEIETAEAIKREREAAMRKRVAKAVKEEMDEEIEKEKAKAEQVKREVELEIKKETEEDIEKEKELEKEIKEEMARGMRKEIAEQIKKDKEIEDSKKASGQLEKEAEASAPKKSEESGILPQTDIFPEPAISAAKIADAPHNLPISRTFSPNNQESGKTQTDEENKKTQQLKKEKDDREKIAREKSAAEKERIQKERERLIQLEAEKEMKNKKEIAIDNSEGNFKNEDLFAPKAAWRASSLKPEFYPNAPKIVPVSGSIPKVVSPLAAESAPDSISASSSVSPLLPNSPKEPKFSDLGAKEPVSEENIKSPIDFPPKKKASSYSAEHPFTFKAGQKKTAKKQYFEFSGEYEHLNPEMRLAQQGFSSLSADLAEGARKDAEFMDQDLVLKKNIAESGALPNKFQAKNRPSLLEKSLEEMKQKNESSSIFKTILKMIKIAALLLLLAGIFYGIYYFVFKTASPATTFPAVGQSAVAGIKRFELVWDFNSKAMPAIREYARNNAASAENVSRIAIKDKTEGKILKISDFEKALGVIMPAKFLDNLAEDYDLIVFNYPKNNYLRMGMVLRIKNADLAASLAKEWEPLMFAGTNPFLFDESGFYNSGKKFSQSSYKNISIRYLPLGKNNLALNYAIDKNRNLFLFATSQDDIHYLIDEVQK